MTTPMTPSYNRNRGDLTGSLYKGRVDVYYDGVVVHDQWGRPATRSETVWGDWSPTGDVSELAKQIAERVGGQVVQEYFDPHCNGGTGYRWVASVGAAIVVVPATAA